jgi:hypothetical protein
MAFCAGPFAWALNQGIGYAAMKPLCAGAATYVVWLIAAVSFAIIILGSWTAWRLCACFARHPSMTAPLVRTAAIFWRA